MCLAEALLRVPDTETIDALIEDKIGASDWATHLGHSSSPLVNASTWALLLTGKVLGEAEQGLAGALHEAIRRLGEPVIRTAVAQAMRELGHQFVLGRDMREATRRAAAMEAQGYTHSYDMLGEAARTEADARRYHLAYSASITALAGIGRGAGIRDRPGVSVKLSALHARYEFAQRDRVMTELVGRLRSLALLAQSAGIGLNVDAEEADRLDLSLDVVETVLADPALAGWDGFGVVVQAYGKRAPHVIDWLYELAGQLERRIMVRLVKGAYWDTEVKRAQVLGLDGFPVFTRKASTDVSFLACTRRLLAMTDRIYPQFATHNAHTMAAVLHMAGDTTGFEFQRLHGMGEALHAGGARNARHPLPDLRPGGRASRPARLPRPAPARERRQQLVREPDRRRERDAGGDRARSDRGGRGARRLGREPAHRGARRPLHARSPQLEGLGPDRSARGGRGRDGARGVPNRGLGGGTAHRGDGRRRRARRDPKSGPSGRRCRPRDALGAA